MTFCALSSAKGMDIKMTEEIGAAMTVKEDIQYFTVEIVFSEKE